MWLAALIKTDLGILAYHKLTCELKWWLRKPKPLEDPAWTPTRPLPTSCCVGTCLKTPCYKVLQKPVFI